MRVIPRPWLLVNPGLAPNLSSRPRGDGCGGPTKLISDSSNPARNGPTRRPTRGSAGPRVGPRPPLSRRGCGWLPGHPTELDAGLRNPVQSSQRLGPRRTLTNIEARSTCNAMWTSSAGATTSARWTRSSRWAQLSHPRPTPGCVTRTWWRELRTVHGRGRCSGTGTFLYWPPRDGDSELEKADDLDGDNLASMRGLNSESVT